MLIFHEKYFPLYQILVLKKKFSFMLLCLIFFFFYYFLLYLKVDIALECARLQHRFALPPLEVHDFPQVGYVMSQSNDVMYDHQSTTNPTDIVQEILSVAQASHDLTNQEYSWDGNYNNINYGDDFSFLPHTHNNHDLGNSFNFMDQLKEDDDHNNSIPIAHFDEDFKSESMVERLRWVGVSQKDDQVLSLINFITFFCFNLSDTIIYLSQNLPKKNFLKFMI